MNKVSAIILAAGKGTRMQSAKENKVTLELGGKPMIAHTVELLKQIKISPIVLVVGFQKESVVNLFKNDKNIIFAEQRHRNGTAHAVQIALKKNKQEAENILILQGDDSAFYKKETIENLIKEHIENDSAFTFLTIDVKNPFGLGRIVRDQENNLVGIVEEKDATKSIRKIKEINPACYVARTAFLKKYLKMIKPSPVTGEYYLTSLIDMGLAKKEKIHAHRAGSIPWRGVNTKEELDEAAKLFKEIKNSI
jgi:bifunctional UDP-N-acetylglucosamine pyrophosphorylase / glucosamine-1-phosphate N-acetyltransferase